MQIKFFLYQQEMLDSKDKASCEKAQTQLKLELREDFKDFTPFEEIKEDRELFEHLEEFKDFEPFEPVFGLGSLYPGDFCSEDWFRKDNKIKTQVKEAITRRIQTKESLLEWTDSPNQARCEKTAIKLVKEGFTTLETIEIEEKIEGFKAFCNETGLDFSLLFPPIQFAPATSIVSCDGFPDSANCQTQIITK